MGLSGGASGKESESEVAQSCLTLCDPVDCSPPGSCVHGILQARVLEWVAIDRCLGCIKCKSKIQNSLDIVQGS